MERDERSEGEVSEDEEPQEPARETSAAAVGRAPGKSTNNLSLSDALNDLLGVVKACAAGSVAPPVRSTVEALDQLAENRPASSGSRAQFKDLLEGLRALVGFEGGQGQPPQVAPWAVPANGIGEGGYPVPRHS